MTIAELAEKARSYFKLRTRKGGEQFWTHMGKAPEWVQGMVRDAHGDLMPDDWRYQFIVDALAAIAEGVDDSEIEADIYNADLLRWVSSNLRRISYCDDAAEEYGAVGLIPTLSAGQVAERREVYASVLASLEAREGR